MRIGNVLESQQKDTASAVPTTNYSKADIKKQVKLDITGLGKDTEFCVDQGRSLQDVKDAAGALDVQTARKYMTVMSNTMSKEDFSKMEEEGFDPANLDEEKATTILDHIKAVMAESGQIVEGYNDNLDLDTLISITGSSADANALYNAMKEADINDSIDNAESIVQAAERMADIGALNDNAVKYMIELQLNPTIDNIYKANYSAGNSRIVSKGYYALDKSGYLGKKSEVSGDELMKDILTAVKRFGIEDIQEQDQIDAAKWLIEKDLNVTETNVRMYNELRNIQIPFENSEVYRRAAFSIKEGKEAKDASLARDYEDIYTKAASILEKTKDTETSAVDRVVSSGKELNLYNLWNTDRQASVTENTSFSEGKLALEEVRLRMTLDINVSLLKRGIEIDTVPLTKLVEELKQEQNHLNRVFFGDIDDEQLQTKAQLYNNTTKAVKEIPYLPAAVIGRTKLEEDYSLSMVHETGTELKAKYEAAGQSYETLMTAPRRDMGDTITKAFRNVDDILADLHMEAVEENRKAVRILGFNSMPINEENINRIKDETEKVLRVVEGLTPAKTLELIRSDINPLDMKLEELSAVLDTMNPEEKDERYASFLYKLERDNKITPMERASYIGIYRLMNRLEKTDGAAIGAMVNQNREITFRSLISGMRSSKFSLDVEIDDNFGFLDKVVSKGISITSQIESAYKSKAGETYETSQNAYTNEKYEEYVNNLKEAAKYTNTAVVLPTLNEEIAAHYSNDLNNNPFERLKKLTEKYDREIESRLAKLSENMVDSLEDRESAISQYEQIIKTVSEYTQEMQDTHAETYVDVKALMLCNKQMTVMGNLSKQEEYSIPVYSNGEFAAVKLMFNHSDSQKGKIDISYDSREYGTAVAHLQMDESAVSGMIVCESKEGFDKMGKVVGGLSQKGTFEFNINVIIGKENQINTVYDNKNAADINNVNTKALYNLAKEFIKEIMAA